MPKGERSWCERIGKRDEEENEEEDGWERKSGL
jgi:hypothetical protein